MLKSNLASGAVLAAALAVASPITHAQAFSNDNFYAGANLAFLATTISGDQTPGFDGGELEADADIVGVYGRFGMFFNPNFSGEVRAGFGTSEEEVDFDGQVGDLDLKNFYGVYLRGGLPINDMFSPYAVLGYTWLDTELTSADEAPDIGDDDSDISYGVGVDINFADVITGNIEYIVLMDADAEFGGLTIGVSKSF